MSDLATYTFLPWLRQGIANQINSHDGARATVRVELILSGDRVGGGTLTAPPIGKDIQLYGPGDLTGLDHKAIIKVEPRNGNMNFEPNFLPYIEFYDEDLPWRYSPLPNPGDHRLTPWLALVVLAEGEFKEGENIRDSALPFITLTGGNPAAVLPPSDQLWAWAHVHVNQGLITGFRSEDGPAVGANLTAALDANPDLAYSRIICPRRLKAQTAYTAFLVPVFEAGRLAGLKEDPGAAAWNELAWRTDRAPDRLPYYYRWYFRTSTVGDFEYLVRLLEPKPADSRVGLRDMDVQKPEANLKGISDERLGGILKLGGALRLPRINYTDEELAEVEKYDNWAQPYPHAFQSSLAAFINLADDYRTRPAAQANADAPVEEETGPADPGADAAVYSIGTNPDPIITAPLYGQWHALTQRLLHDPGGNAVPDNTNWVHELNLDPRWRVAAGFGTKIIQENQETYMEAAWNQVGDVLEANRKIRAAQLALAVSQVWYNTHLKAIRESNTDKWLALAAPMGKRVLSEGTTVHFAVQQSKVPPAATSLALRKVLRPRGKLAQRLTRRGDIGAGELIGRLNRGEVTAAPPKKTPAGIVSLAKIAETLRPERLDRLQGEIQGLMGELPAYRKIWVQLAGELLKYLSHADKEQQLENAALVAREIFDPGRVDQFPPGGSFRPWSPEDERFDAGQGGEDNEEARLFKKALREIDELMLLGAKLGAVREKPPLDVERVSNALFERINPSVTIPRWTWSGIRLPDRIRTGLRDAFAEVMAYPEFDLPMYQPLVDHSAELFLPNINYLAQNSISLLETNQKFIEAYMVGLNHEFARELLWREYPTDQRGSYFRQFWEVKGFLDGAGLSPAALKEKLKDIPPLHLWRKTTGLGEHDHREQGGANEEEVVLAIRGELLKKYPNAVIYAHRAEWVQTDGRIDLTRERQLVALAAGEEANPPRTIIKTPLYEAKADPDIRFFGFDLTACAAKGGPGKPDQPVDPACRDANIPWDDAGWFFVIKERPGEPRFGFDIEKEPSLPVHVWNDLSWNHLTPAVPEGGFIQITGADRIRLKAPVKTEDLEKRDQFDEDKALEWNQHMSSAELAYILYQVPVLVAVHASEMLPDH